MLADAVLCLRSLTLQDGGLGASARGLAEPILVNIKRTREGLGCASEPPIAAASAASSASSEAMLHDFRCISAAPLLLALDFCLPLL